GGNKNPRKRPGRVRGREGREGIVAVGLRKLDGLAHRELRGVEAGGGIDALLPLLAVAVVGAGDAAQGITLLDGVRASRDGGGGGDRGAVADNRGGCGVRRCGGGRIRGGRRVSRGRGIAAGGGDVGDRAVGGGGRLISLLLAAYDGQ